MLLTLLLMKTFATTLHATHCVWGEARDLRKGPHRQEAHHVAVNHVHSALVARTNHRQVIQTNTTFFPNEQPVSERRGVRRLNRVRNDAFFGRPLVASKDHPRDVTLSDLAHAKRTLDMEFVLLTNETALRIGFEIPDFDGEKTAKRHVFISNSADAIQTGGTLRLEWTPAGKLIATLTADSGTFAPTTESLELAVRALWSEGIHPDEIWIRDQFDKDLKERIH